MIVWSEEYGPPSKAGRLDAKAAFDEAEAAELDRAVGSGRWTVPSGRCRAGAAHRGSVRCHSEDSFCRATLPAVFLARGGDDWMS